MPIGNPNCRQCLGTGERERIEMAEGQIVAFVYEPCSCTFHPQWNDEENWTNDRRERT